MSDTPESPSVVRDTPKVEFVVSDAPVTGGFGKGYALVSYNPQRQYDYVRMVVTVGCLGGIEIVRFQGCLDTNQRHAANRPAGFDGIDRICAWLLFRDAKTQPAEPLANPRERISYRCSRSGKSPRGFFPRKTAPR